MYVMPRLQNIKRRRICRQDRNKDVAMKAFQIHSGARIVVCILNNMAVFFLLDATFIFLCVRLYPRIPH